MALIAIASVPTFVVIAACTDASKPPPAGETGGGSHDSSSEGGHADTGSPNPVPDAGGDGATAHDATGDETGDATQVPEGGANLDASVFGDVVIGPPADAAASDVGPPSDGSIHGSGNVCAQLLGWWTVGATLDTGVVGASAGAALNPLLSSQNPITLADSFLDGGPSDAGPSWLYISGTKTNGASQQYFPFTNPATPAALVQAPGANPVFTATSPSGQPSTGWIRLLDSTQAEVWIALTNISATMTAGDSLCQSISTGQVDAVIPTGAGATTMVLASGSTSVASVFGATTSASPPGWNIRLKFTAQRVQVTFK